MQQANLTVDARKHTAGVAITHLDHFACFPPNVRNHTSDVTLVQFQRKNQSPALEEILPVADRGKKTNRKQNLNIQEVPVSQLNKANFTGYQRHQEVELPSGFTPAADLF